MTRVTIAEIPSHDGEQVLLSGWLYALRGTRKVLFPLLRDGTGMVQCVATKTRLGDELFGLVEQLTQESSITLTGTVRNEERAPGGYEVDVDSLEVIQRISESDPFPITPKEHGFDFLLENRHLWLRSRRQTAIQRVRATIDQLIREFFHDKGFMLVHAPVFTATSTGNSAEAFVTRYFRLGDVYLSQSAQQHNEAAATALGSVYSIGPVFSAGLGKTRRDLAEFWLAETEMPFASASEAINVAEGLIKFIVLGVLAQRDAELNILERETDKLKAAVEFDFDRYTYGQSVELLVSQGSPMQVGQEFCGADMAQLMTDRAQPLVVVQHPVVMRPIIAPVTNPIGVVDSLEVLAPEGYGTIVTGGARIQDPAVLHQHIVDYGLEVPKWYLDLRKYGSVPMAGFGLSLDLTTAWICGLEHVREAIMFPRTMSYCRP